ncbi:carnosine synthase 1-like [Amphiura filiformis]|uniref:carnosine synthase 1-like n=1 Tax=Amphiura filiformis TaxID=82378 RepID=UPI003B2182A9
MQIGCTPKTEGYEENGVFVAHGTYIDWETDVNLGAPFASTKKQNVQVTKPEKKVAMFYNSLQYTLYETGFPETVDRTSMPRRNINKEQVVVAVLSTPYECIGMLLECGQQVSDTMHLIFCPSWVSKEPSKDHPGLYSVYVHKAITFHKSGATYIDEFLPPRRVTYLVNFFTSGITHGLADWGSDMELKLDCQMSSSQPLCDMIHDKLWTRHLMSKVGVAVPETLAFKIEDKRKVPNSDAIKICVLGKCVKTKKSGEEPPRVEVQHRKQCQEQDCSCRIEALAKMAAQTNADNPFVYTSKQIEEDGSACTCHIHGAGDR